jgi:heme exporter protein D
MTLGMPREASVRSTVLATASATLAFGSSALVIAVVLVVLRNLNSPTHNVWLALLYLLPIAAGMVVTHFRRTMPVMIAYLVVGAASIGFYSSILITNAPVSIQESPFILALPQIAFVYTVAPSVFGVRSIVYICAAYLSGQAAVLGAAIQAGRFPSFDYLTLAATVVILLISVSNLVLRRRSVIDHRAVERARREAVASQYQQELESQVVSLFHDTVLSELTVLSHQAPGPVSTAQRAAIERDLAMIEKGAWWPQEVAGAPADTSAAALTPAIAGVLAESRAAGLSIDLSGDLASLHRLTPGTSMALALAVRQALVNVRQHSGVERAEIVVDGAPDAVVVMLADAGTGFDPAAVPGDRLGVTQSIRGRIRDAGGEAQLWTSPGSGTAYMFTLPAAAEHSWEGP